MFYYILVQQIKQQRDCYWTSICLHTTMEKKARHGALTRNASQEESSPCTAGARENRHSCALGEASPAKHSAKAPRGSGARTAPSAAAQTRRSSSLCTFPSAEAQQGLAGARELLRELDPALPCSHFPPLQLCWQQLALCPGHGSAPYVVQTVELQALALGHSSGSSATVQGNRFLSAPVKCLNTKALPLVLFLEPCLGVALLQKSKRSFTVMKNS